MFKLSLEINYANRIFLYIFFKIENKLEKIRFMIMYVKVYHESLRDDIVVKRDTFPTIVTPVKPWKD